MFEARADHEWSIASHQMALAANIARSPGRKAFKPSDFMPRRKKKTAAFTIDDVIRAFVPDAPLPKP